MRMDLGLTQTLKQIQTLSPQMYMSMEILCLNSLDLEDRIETELENNVALELKDSEGSSDDDSRADGAEGATAERADEGSAADELFDRKVEQWDQLARDEYDSGPRRRSAFDGEKDDKLEALNNTEGRPLSLAQHLEEQLHLISDENLLLEFGVETEEVELIRELGAEILYNLDERGYLLFPIDEIHRGLLERLGAPLPEEPAAETGSDGAPAEAGSIGEAGPIGTGSAASPEPVSGEDPADAFGAASLGVSMRDLAPAAADVPEADPSDASLEEVIPGPREVITSERMIKALKIVRGLDPPGIGGIDLKECLLLQLERDRQPYPIETKIISDHLDDLANNRLPKIAKALGITIDDVKTAAETISSLNPIPGKLYGGQPPQYIKPDVLVEEVNGRYEVQVLSNYLPRLKVSEYYLALYKRSRKDPELKKFIKKKLESAEWLLAAIRQRQSTLERIAREVVEIQEGFLTSGLSHLKPLKMVDVAERVGVHVSTVSRAISGKYMQSPQGLHALKFFFTGGAQKSDGTMEARGSVIQRIKDLVEQEDKQHPLSDKNIVSKLMESGIGISRRTVTKYREAENIPSSRQRRAY